MLSSCNSWVEAFDLASKIEEEDKNPLIIKRQTTDDEYGAFSQPKKLSTFVLEVTSSSFSLPLTDSSSSHNIESIKEEIGETKVRFSLEERCSRQICRNWLKNTFLQLGDPCKAAEGDCSRMHELPLNPLKLHSDFSFKGLNPKNKKIILDAAKVLSSNYSHDDIKIEENEEDEGEKRKKKKQRN